MKPNGAVPERFIRKYYGTAAYGFVRVKIISNKSFFSRENTAYIPNSFLLNYNSNFISELHSLRALQILNTTHMRLKSGAIKLRTNPPLKTSLHMTKAGLTLPLHCQFIEQYLPNLHAVASNICCDVFNLQTFSFLAAA